ncbi:MAG: hypothetical protein Q8S12_09720 [Hydrogenophaga sp.]|nr:hypothetical protein [Hydrogenophaga sp.]MDP3626867.1 hypothetical protein [Hydrogenophaga sp.]
MDGVTIPLQSDEISSHRDGSARFAVLSAQLANMQPGQTRIVNLYTGAKTVSTPSALPASPDWNLELEAQVFDANGNVTANLIAQPQAQLMAQIANGSGRRLAGSVASEYTVVTSFKDKSTNAVHPHLTARLHTRLVDAGTRIRTDVVMENTRTWTVAPSNINYSMTIKRNGLIIHTQPKFKHHIQSRWHKVIWSDPSTAPKARVRHQMNYFVNSKAIWNYNIGLSIPETVLANQYLALQQARQNQIDLGPMANIFLAPYMPMTGGRGEIGPLPQWTATYLLSQDDRALEVMLANMDAAGSVPIHYRDDVTGEPLDIDTHPQVSVRFGKSIPALPSSTDYKTIWSADTAHQGSYAYVPYLITGDVFYQDEMMFWAGWNLASPNPDYRGKGAGIISGEQVRAQAWALRSIWEAATALPNNHRLKGYFESKLLNNLNWYAAAYPENPNAKALYPLNAVPKPDEKHLTGPWQNDFLMLVFSLMAENQEPKAKNVATWLGEFNVNRFLKEHEGFCSAKAPGYYFTIVNESNNPITTWADLFNRNWPGVTCAGLAIDPASYPNSAIGYAANARAMLAAATNAGIPNASTAYTKWVSMTPGVDQPMTANPTWAIIPRSN